MGGASCSFNMKAIYQRVSSASVEVEGKEVAAIGTGALLLLGVKVGDTPKEAASLARKAANLRIFSDNSDKYNVSVLDVGGSILVVPNFTLYGNCRHGRRPEFLNAARPEQALPLMDSFVRFLREAGVNDVQTGVFGAHMHVSLLNDGPVTLILDTDDWNDQKG
jgi:D-tyrosyl-tRNA(Tyr) deacylase